MSDLDDLTAPNNWVYWGSKLHNCRECKKERICNAYTNKCLMANLYLCMVCLNTKYRWLITVKDESNA